MAESSSGAGGSWWDGWIQAAKEKSSQTLELIKHDLSEFTTVCTQDASTMVSHTSEKLQESLQATGEQTNTERVKKGFTQLLGGISKVLTVPPDDDDQDDALRVTQSGGLEVFDKAKARLYEIQISPQTYCTEPDGPIDKFNDWKLTFDLESKKGDISELLVSVDEVRTIYTKLVPSAVTHSDFWERYYYKVHQLQQDEKRKADLKNRADKLKEDQAWDEDDWETEEIVIADASQSADDVPTMLTLQTEYDSPESTAQSTKPSANEQTVDYIKHTANDNPVHLNASPKVVTDTTRSPPEQSTNSSPSSEMITDTTPSPKGQSTNIPDSDSTSTLTESVNPQTVKSLSTLSELADAKLQVSDAAEVTKQQDSSKVKQQTAVSETKDEVEDIQSAKIAEPQTTPSSLPTETKVVDITSSPGAGDTVVDSTDCTGETTSQEDSITVKEKGGYVMLGSERPTPSSSIGSNAKESSSGLDDEWDKELFGDDLKAVEELAQRISEGKEEVNVDEEWEDWE